MITPGDSIGRASEALRVSGLSELPVVNSGRVIGMISERSILDALAVADPFVAADQPVVGIMTDHFPTVNPYMMLSQASEMLEEMDVQVLPVVNEYGMFLGIVSRTDVIGALCQTMRPPSIGGLATPLGVFLTTGNHRAGAGDFGLFLTGVSLGMFRYIAAAIITAIAWAVQRVTSFDLFAMLNSPATGKLFWMDYVAGAMALLALGLFGLLLRLSPLAGYHAAEHQVVNAIENGEPLKPECVASMPRVHPRCGTNILISVVVFLMVAHAFSYDTAVLITIFVLIFAWKTIGGYFQYYVTTKTPSAKQLASGIKAGNGILTQYRENPACQAVGVQRIWNMGMLQVMAGMLATMALEPLLSRVLPGLF